MAYTSGTAANYKDLLAVMTTFAAANGWTVLEQSATKVYLRGEGLAGLDEIYVGVETYEDAVNNRYNWNMVGSWGWRSGRGLNSHPRTSNLSGTDLSVGYFWNSSIPYWMVANGRRIIVVAKVGTTYQMVHLGLLTPPATDAQYPYPLLIGGSGKVNTQNYSATIASFWSSFAGNYPGSRLNLPNGYWANASNAQSYEHNPGFMVMTICGTDAANILSGLDGTYLLEPFYMVAAVSATGIYGQVEGLFRVSGHNNTSENIITVSGINYIVFQDGSRSGYGDFCAMRMN